MQILFPVTRGQVRGFFLAHFALDLGAMLQLAVNCYLI
jgi:hypothetical protein